MIAPNQGAFVEGRWIAENTVNAHELVHKVKKHKGKNRLMLLKINLKKALDRIEWSFLDVVLGAWGFSNKFRNMIFSCVSSIKFSLLINGSLCGEFSPSRGLR